MRFTSSSVLLREYVRQVLNEDDAGGNPAMYTGNLGMAGENPYGVSFGSEDALMKTFISPFTDVFKTAMGKTKEISRKARTLLTVAFGTIMTTLIPGLGANYAKVFEKEEEDINKIRSEYADVYKATDDAFGSDAALLAFMASPGLVIGAKAAQLTPVITKNLLSAVTGGGSDELFDATKEKLKSAGKWMIGDDSGGGGGGSRRSGKSPSSVFGETQLHEEDDESGKKKGKGGTYSTEKLLKNKKFLAKALDNPEAQKMQKAATQIYRGTLQNLYAEAENVLKKAKTAEDLQKMMKTKIPELDKVKTMPPEEKKKAEAQLIDGVRKSMKKFYVKNLKDQLQKVLDAGVPTEAQYVKDYKAMIQKIESL